MATSTQDLMLANLAEDMSDWLKALNRKVTNSDYQELVDHGMEPVNTARFWLKGYEGTHNVARDLAAKVRDNRTLSMPQIVLALNLWRESFGTKITAEPPTLECFSCGEAFVGWDALKQHKVDAHSSAPVPERVDETPAGSREGVAVIEDTTSERALDLTGLPDGRYALPDPSGKNLNVFLMVKRVKRTFRRDRRYKYGQFITGGEIVEAGTIEVKLWSSDSKELIGEQRPGDTYRGKFEEQMELCALSPETFARLFGRLQNRCCICGKELTDDESRAIGMGLECEKKHGYWVLPPKSYVATCEHPMEDGKPCGSSGRMKGFHHLTGVTFYDCIKGHKWTVSKKGVTNEVDTFPGWVR